MSILYRYLPDLISIWHFGVWKYGPDSPPVFYRLWKHEHDEQNSHLILTFQNQIQVKYPDYKKKITSLWDISPSAKNGN